MYTTGFIDDDKESVKDYKIRLGRKGINLLFVEGCKSKRDVLDWILDNQIKCMLVDYKLSNAYEFNGAELVAFINSELADLPCIILTNYCEEGYSENLVIKNLFIKRELLSADFESAEFENLISTFKQAIDVFDNRLKLRLSEYEELKTKKDVKDITSNEEERFVELFKILRIYHEVDDVPAELITSSASEKMNEILQSLDRLINKDK
jgi:CheY-like chemotaxis protein